MNIIKRLIKTIKSLFSFKRNNVKRIEQPKEEINNFKETIKVSKLNTDKNNIKVPVCIGNGAGISDTMSY